jgi:glycerophosphoryl diester phosphodiesterase
VADIRFSRRRFLQTVSVGAVALSGISASADDRQELTPAARLIRAKRVLVIAHRGESRAAIRAKADLVELDYYHSADGIPVVFHDANLDRTTDAKRLWGGSKIPLVSKTLRQLKTLDAGSWFDAKFAGTRIPTLDESLDLIQQDAVTLIEHKQGTAAACVALLKHKDLLERVVVQSFNWKFLAECRRLAPTLVLGALGNKRLTAERLEQARQTGASVIGWNHKWLTPDQIKAIHRAGLKAWVYTVNDRRRVVVLKKSGIDGIITDVPRSVRAALR